MTLIKQIGADLRKAGLTVCLFCFIARDILYNCNLFKYLQNPFLEMGQRICSTLLKKTLNLNMRKYITTLIFYVVAFAVVYVLNWLSPGAHDGGIGLGGLALILLVFVIIALIGVSIYKGIKKSKDHFIIAAIHFLILLGLIFQLFI